MEGVASLLNDAGPQSSRLKTIPGEKKAKTLFGLDVYKNLL